MELTLKRISKQKAYTIGKLYIQEASPMGEGLEGATYLCDILEPPCVGMKSRTVKDPLTLSPAKAQQLKPFAIPEGRYPVVITYSKKFNQWLPLLIGVPLFSGIRIHAGNYPFETQGCLLPGENKKKGMVLNSGIWLRRIVALITEGKKDGAPVFITITS